MRVKFEKKYFWIFLEMVLYLFVTVIENGISVIKSSLISIEETKKFKDLLDTVLKKDTFYGYSLSN